MKVDEPKRRCVLCNELDMILLGHMNGVAIHFCEKCDRVHSNKKG